MHEVQEKRPVGRMLEGSLAVEGASLVDHRERSSVLLELQSDVCDSLTRRLVTAREQRGYLGCK